MVKRNKLGKVVKRVQGYTIRFISEGKGYGVYAGKNLKSKDYLANVDDAIKECESLLNK